MPIFRPYARLRLRLLLVFGCAAACAANASAQGIGSAGSRYTGMPDTGQLDWDRVTGHRYRNVPKKDTPAQVPAGSITYVVLDSADPSVGAQENVPVTFGQVFARGDLARGETLTGMLADGSNLALQVDVKARHADGSVRHAIVSTVLARLPSGESRTLGLAKAAAPQQASGTDKVQGTPATPRAGWNTLVAATIDGVRYTASADDLLKQQKAATWIAGPVVTEWQVSAPLKNARGVAHPHLAAHFALRWYPDAGKARVDVSVENNWAYQPDPQNIRYDAELVVGGKQVYAKSAFTHLHHARWRKVFWTGEAPALDIRHDTRYLIATRAVPNYDQSLLIPEASLAALKARWNGPLTQPMGVGLATPAMPGTGGRDDIGLLPAWGATYLLSMDKRAKQATLGTADLSGSWSIHYRDQRTNRPVSLIDFPYMTLLGHPGDTHNPATGKQEMFPPCAAPDACNSPYQPDIPHQPNLTYLPYLVTGDYYYLEELQFWAMWDVFSSNPGYRDNIKGLLRPEQVRGQAWALRTLAEAAYATPDADPLKAHFEKILASNLDWYNTTYSNNPTANRLGVLINGYAVVYNNGTGIAPWQDDFFTSAVGHAVDLGFTQAAPLLAWKAKFPVARMVGDGACWIDAAQYAMNVRPSATAPLYTSIAQAYRASHTAGFSTLSCAGAEMASELKLRVGEMTGYAPSVAGYPANMQPALAYASTVSGEAGKRAWALFIARAVKPDYGIGPQFAIVPR